MALRLLVVGGDELVDEALGVNPTQRMIADAELAGVVGDDDGVPEQAFGFDCPPQRRFAGEAHRIGRDPQVGKAERAQVDPSILMRAKSRNGMAGEPVDDVLRQIGAVHIGDRGGVDHIAAPRRRADRLRKARRDLPGPVRNAANRSEPMWVVKQPLPAWRAPVSSTVMKGALGKPRPQHSFVLGAEVSSLAVKSRTT